MTFSPLRIQQRHSTYISSPAITSLISFSLLQDVPIDTLNFLSIMSWSKQGIHRIKHVVCSKMYMTPLYSSSIINTTRILESTTKSISFHDCKQGKQSICLVCLLGSLLLGSNFLSSCTVLEQDILLSFNQGVLTFKDTIHEIADTTKDDSSSQMWARVYIQVHGVG